MCSMRASESNLGFEGEPKNPASLTIFWLNLVCHILVVETGDAFESLEISIVFLVSFKFAGDDFAVSWEIKISFSFS